MARLDIKGVRFGRLLVIELHHIAHVTYWLCRCDCGTEAVVAGHRLVIGKTKSCGCLKGEKQRTHGLSRTAEHFVWKSMNSRCYRKSDHSFRDYGGRGITVCDRWQGTSGFANFIADMGPRPSPEHSIDRFPDNNGNYEPGNCRWATRLEQGQNKRNNRLIESGGEAMLLRQWQERTGLSKPGLLYRIKMGIPLLKKSHRKEMAT